MNKSPALLLIAALVSITPATAQIFKYTDKSGNVVYSDTNNPHGKDVKIELEPLNVIPSSPESPPAQAPGSTEESVAKPEAEKKPIYNTLVIASPGNGETIRANSGDVTIKVQSTPPLDVAAGDILRLSLDSAPAAQGTSTDILLENLDRGEHLVQVSIQNASGKKLIESAPLTFSVQRHSVLFPGAKSK